MALLHAPAPTKHKQAFAARLADLQRLKRLPAHLSIHPTPLPVYHYGLPDFLSKQDHKAAKHVGWRYFAGPSQSQQTLCADLTLKDESPVARFCYAAASLNALSLAHHVAMHPTLKKYVHEPRILRVPSLLVEALWYKSHSHEDDHDGWLVLYHTLLRDIDRSEPQMMKEVWKRLTPLANTAQHGKMP
jgi:hypothetical protein